ncbi:hypothetical protein CO710_10890 [Acetobacter orleanensis]|nr:hypothetical protein CO710_10890 [Acetobacter orleanensis]
MHHADSGSQYYSEEYREFLSANGFIVPMSRKGNCWDNAVTESFCKDPESGTPVAKSPEHTSGRHAGHHMHPQWFL